MNGAVVNTDLATPALLAVIDRLGNTTNLNRQIADGISNLTRSYIASIAVGRHKTAARLGAKPTGALAATVFRISRNFDSTAAWVEVPRFIFRRAFESYWIRPINGRFLTLATNAASYGRRVAELRREGWQIWRPIKKGAKAAGNRTGGAERRYLDKVDPRRRQSKTTRRTAFFSEANKLPFLIGKKNKSDKPVLLYALKLAVWHDQDRTLLPSDESFIADARRVTGAYALGLAKAGGLV